MAEEKWDDKLDYLQKGRFLYHNDDYLEFLVKKVWGLSTAIKIADFGCGYGYMGIKLLPLLTSGSEYTGIDKAVPLLEAADKIYAQMPYPHQFVESEVYQVPFEDNSFDVTVSHAVLMHLEKPIEALKEMIRVTREGGLVITCNANRTAHSALLYIDEVNLLEAVPLGLPQQLNKDIRQKTGIDYDIGIKTPVLMDRAGLKDIGCRISDCAVCLFPTMEESEKKRLFDALCNEGLGSPMEPDWDSKMLSHGVNPNDIKAMKDLLVKEDFVNKGLNYHTVFPGMMVWSFGTKTKHSI
jgi:2-polyprenyl-3-methyl-5-hydroxy-6-metoxy-1,4-benzoquinol methylase